MQNRITGIIVGLLIVLAACEQEEVFIATQETDKLTGYWVKQQLTDTLFTYEKSDQFISGEYGFAFLPEGRFAERKNSGWCGTPPIAYADFEGSWSLNDSTVSVSVGYWGGTVTYLWRVVSLDNESLVIDVVLEDYSLENQDISFSDENRVGEQ